MTASLLARPARKARDLAEVARSIGWVLAAMLGLAVGGFVLHFPGSYGEFPGWELGPGVFGLVLGAVNGIAFGLLLWLAAGGGWVVGRRLIVFGALAVGLTHALHDASSILTPYPVVAAVSGACVALAWWLAFREGPPWQAGVAGVAWAIGLLAARSGSAALGLPWEQTPVGWSTDHAVQGLIVGLVWGGATVLIRPATGDATSRPLPPASGRPD